MLDTPCEVEKSKEDTALLEVTLETFIISVDYLHSWRLGVDVNQKIFFESDISESNTMLIFLIKFNEPLNIN